MSDVYRKQLELAVDQAKLNLRSAELDLERYTSEVGQMLGAGLAGGASLRRGYQMAGIGGEFATGANVGAAE